MQLEIKYYYTYNPIIDNSGKQVYIRKQGLLKTVKKVTGQQQSKEVTEWKKNGGIIK